MIDAVSVCIFGGLILIAGAYVVAIAPRWQHFKRSRDTAFWIGLALVLVGYFQLRQPH